MQQIKAVFHRFNAFFPGYFFLLLRYGLVLALMGWIVFKMCAIESLLQSQQHFLQKISPLPLQQTLMAKQLNHLETKLIAFEALLKMNQAWGNDIKACLEQLATLKDEVRQLQEQTATALISAFKHVHATPVPSNKLISQTAQVDQEKTSLIPKNPVRPRKMTAKDLPFQVCNIDVWNGEPMVMVNHQGHPDLLAKQDTLAGWTMVEINFDGGWARFKNRQGQSVQSFL